MVQIRSALRLYAYGALGVFLLAAPWTTAWDQATLALLPSEAGAWITSGWMRGAVSGLGTLDLLVAGLEAGRLWRTLQPRR